MVLLYAAVKKDSFSLLEFLLLSHVKVISYTISPFCCLKYPYSCFSSHVVVVDVNSVLSRRKDDKKVRLPNKMC